MVVMAPKDESELRDMLYTAVEHHAGPVALRYPRGTAFGVPLKKGFEKIEIGKGEILRTGNDIAILSVGTMVFNSLEAADILAKEGILAEVVNMRFVKPIDKNLLEHLLARFDRFVTVEENSVLGGFGAGILETLTELKHGDVKVRVHGVPDEFIEHGSPAELHKIVKLDAAGIAEVVREFCEANPPNIRSVERKAQ
jgi:1-deoxy-D-xylulose-5-phosphate synthase